MGRVGLLELGCLESFEGLKYTFSRFDFFGIIYFFVSALWLFRNSLVQRVCVSLKGLITFPYGVSCFLIYSDLSYLFSSSKSDIYEALFE